MSVHAPPVPEHPALAEYFQDRARSFQNRLADAITRFAGSMPFIYIHVLWFAIWIGLRVEKFPFGLLTMIVSLEAIILSTFILISQNRSDLARQTFADHQYRMIQAEERQNEELLALSRRILERLEQRG